MGLFPRGIGNLEEVPFEYVERCVVVPEAIDDDNQDMVLETSLISKALDILAKSDIGWDFLVPRDWARAMSASKGMRALLHDKPEWMSALGYKLIKQPAGFSPSVLLGILMQDPAFSGAAWRTSLLTDRVQERVLGAGARVNLVAMSTPDDSVEFWTDRLIALLSLPNMPTGPQTDEVHMTVEILVDKTTGKGMSDMLRTCLAVSKPNSTVGPVILKDVIAIAPRKNPSFSSSISKSREKTGVVKNDAADAMNDDEGAEPSGKRSGGMDDREYLDSEAVSDLLVKCGGATAIRTLVMLMGGVRVDELKVDVRKLPKLKGVKIPRSIRAAVVKTLAKSSWFSLLGVFRFEMFFKSLFKSIHIVEILTDKDGRATTKPDMTKVYLLQSLLRGEAYPKDEETFNTLTQKGRPWDKLIAAPLSVINRDPLFDVDSDWTATGYQERLAGKKIPKPTAVSVENMLCAHGNRRRTWHAILDCGQITPPQILRNLVNLAMMNFPVDRVQSHLLQSIDRVSITDLMKVHAVIKTTLAPNKIAELVDAAVTSSKANNAGVKQHIHPEPPEKKRRVSVSGGEGSNVHGQDDDEVRVERAFGVADKKGQRRQIERRRTVSTKSGPTAVGAYITMLESLISTKMENLSATGSRKPGDDVTTILGEGMGMAAVTGAAREVVGVISYSEELCRNCVRSGVPPPLPEYTRVAMWRGEDVCLEQLGAGDMNELIVGINWCEPSGSAKPIDLDLSVMVFDTNWTHLADCSWQVPGLRIAGVVHSGDVLSAPYPDGARETCTVDIAGLLQGFPEARYVALVVKSYTRQIFDTLEDASVFVANPHARGSGPGGMAVIGAARLSGASTTSVGGYLDLCCPVEAARKTADKGDSVGVSIPAGSWAEREMKKAGMHMDSAGVTKTGNNRVHFVFTDQATRLSHCGCILEGDRHVAEFARGCSCSFGRVLSTMRQSRLDSGAQSLADAAAFQAALVCDRVVIVSDGHSNVVDGSTGGGAAWRVLSRDLVKSADENRFRFYERIAEALERAIPAAPVAGKEGISNYPAEALRDGGGGIGVGKVEGGKGDPPHIVFFGGDLDAWLEVTRALETYRSDCGMVRVSRNDGAKRQSHEEGATLTLVNLRSAEKSIVKEGGGVTRVNGATAYDELCEAVLSARG